MKLELYSRNTNKTVCLSPFTLIEKTVATLISIPTQFRNRMVIKGAALVNVSYAAALDSAVSRIGT